MSEGGEGGRKIDLGDEDGFVTLAFGEGEARVEARVDLWDFHDRLVDAARKCKDAPEADYYAALREIVSSLGLPQMSNRVLDRMWRRVRDEVERAKAEGKPDAASPASTASTPAV